MRLMLITVLITVGALVTHAQTLTSHYLPAAAGLPGIGFYDFRPKDYTTDPAKKFPLIINLHGKGEKGNGQSDLTKVFTSGIGYLVNHGATMQFNYENNVKGSFVVLMPQLDGTYSDWQAFYMDEMIKWATANLNIDPNRISITGYSLGGGGVWVYPASSVQNASKIAGIIPISASGLYEGDPCNIAQGGVAVWAIHTNDDIQVDSSSTATIVRAINACSPTAPVVGWYPMGNHQIYDQKIFPDTANRFSYPTVYQWMLRVNRNNTIATNTAPNANVGATDTTVVVNSSMRFFQKTLTAALSYDPNDIIVRYSWQMLSNNRSNVYPFNGYQPIDTSTAWPAVDLDYKNLSWPIQNFEFHGLGDYVFKLTVTDMFGASSSQTKTIHITNNGQNTAPFVNLGNDVTLASNKVNPAATTASFMGTQVFDWEAQSMGYKVTQVSGPKTAKLSATNWYQFTVSEMNVAGVYKFTITVTDAGGAVGQDMVTIIKLPDNPVTFADLTGKHDDGKNILTWSTSNEAISDHLDVLRSSNGTSFSVLATLPASTATTDPKSYTYTDESPYEGKSYYRVAQYNVDGTSSLSNIISVIEALPVSYLYFNGKNNGEKNILSWATSAEINNHHFEVLKSGDGATFHVLATLPASMEGGDTKKYSYADASPYDGNSYYRLAQYDTDGTKKLSDIITVSNLQGVSVVTYPNPVGHQLNVAVKGQIKGVIKIKIMDVSGKLIKQMDVTKGAGTLTQTIDLDDLSAGTYMLHLSQENGWHTLQRFLK